MRTIRDFFSSLANKTPDPGGNRWTASAWLHSLVATKSETTSAELPLAPIKGRLSRWLARRKRPTGFWKQVSTGQLSMAPAIAACAGFYALVGVYAFSVDGDPFVLSQAEEAPDEFPGPVVETIDITGLEDELRRGEIIAALKVDYDEPILLLDTNAARVRLEKLAWIKAAVIRRLLPGTLAISIEERRPFALWQRDGELVVIDQDGVVISDIVFDSDEHLPVVVGEGANIHAHEIIAALNRHPIVRNQLRALVRVADRRWNMKLGDQTEVRLPEVGYAAVFAEITELGFALSGAGIVDFRVADRITIRPGPVSEDIGLADAQEPVPPPDDTGGAT